MPCREPFVGAVRNKKKLGEKNREQQACTLRRCQCCMEQVPGAPAAAAAAIDARLQPQHEAAAAAAFAAAAMYSRHINNTAAQFKYVHKAAVTQQPTACTLCNAEEMENPKTTNKQPVPGNQRTRRRQWPLIGPSYLCHSNSDSQAQQVPDRPARHMSHMCRPGICHTFAQPGICHTFVGQA